MFWELKIYECSTFSASEYFPCPNFSVWDEETSIKCTTDLKNVPQGWKTEQTNEYYRMNIGCEQKRILITFCENVKTSIQGEGRLDNCSLNNEREGEFGSHSNRAVCLVQRKSHRFHLCRKDFSQDVLSEKAAKSISSGESITEWKIEI